MMNVETLCLSCMTDRGNAVYCPHCQAPDMPQQQAAIALPFRTLLNRRFLVGRVLGRPGGFGVTYLAWDKTLETTAAIKEFLPLTSVSREPGTLSVQANSAHDQAAFSQGLEVFLKEAKTLAQFSHPHIVRIRDYFTANNTAYLVMDYHQGRPMDHYLQECGGRLSQEQALNVMLPILSGLEAMHDKGFLHRDIKPQNIYLTDRNVPILLDFGAARYALADTTGNVLTVILSAGFAPFEQYHQKGRQGPWTDLYACGATLYYLVTGILPADALERQHADKLIPPIKRNSQLSPAFSQAIMAAMAVSPAARPQQVEAFRKRLLAAVQTMPPPPKTLVSTMRPTANPPQTLRRAPIRPVGAPGQGNGPGAGTLLLGVALFCLLGFGWYAGQRHRPQQPANPAAEPIAMATPAEITAIAPAPPDTASPPPLAEYRNDSPAPQPAIAIAEPESEQSYPHRPPSQHDIGVCTGRTRHGDCPLEPPNGEKTGWCVPTADHNQLICIPKPPPGSRHAGPDNRHPPHRENRP